MDNNKKYFSKQRLENILPAILVALGISFMVFFATPFDIFVNNAEELAISFSQISSYLVLYVAISFVIVFCLLFFLPFKISKPLYVIFVAVFLLLFLQSNLINTIGGDSHYLPTDGEDNHNVVGVVISVVIWLITIAGAVLSVYFVKRQDIVKVVCLVLCVALLAAQLVGAVTTGVSYANQQESVSTETATSNILTTKNLTTVSTQNNVFVFCVDRFDGTQYAEPALKDHPEYFSELEGFTYFTDHISIYGSTYPSILNMLTAKRHNDEFRLDYFKECYENNQTLSTLADNNYLVNLYVEPYYSYDARQDFPQCVSNTVSSEIVYSLKDAKVTAWNFVELSLYRCLPNVLKSLIKVNTGTLAGGIVAETKDYVKYVSEIKTVYDWVSTSEFEVVNNKKVFTFLHFSGCHDSLYDENFVNNGKENDMSIAVKNSFKIIDIYLRQLKKMGLYKNATIIITGDHCAPSSPHRGMVGFFVKPSGVGEGNLRYTSTFTSHDNIWGTIAKSENIQFKGIVLAKSVFDVAEGEQSQRDYFSDYDHYSNWKRNVYKVDGSARDNANWSVVDHIEYNRGFFD